MLPAIGILLDPGAPDLSPVHALAVSQLLTWATSAPAAFKEASGKLDASVKENLESSIRQALGVKSGNASQTSSKPQISLRSF